MMTNEWLHGHLLLFSRVQKKAPSHSPSHSEAAIESRGAMRHKRIEKADFIVQSMYVYKRGLENCW